MLTHAVVVVASAWLVGAQNPPDNNAYHPHASFAFIRTGERTPLERTGVPVLTALGANQMYTLGQNFRSRYVSGESPGGLGVEHIAGMAQNILNNEQILVETLDSQYLISAAQAFMQGLYPPHVLGNGTGTGAGLLADGTAIDYPLNVYQYASIQSPGADDAESIFLNGAQQCPIAKRDAMRYFTSDEFLETKAANEDFYKKLDIDWFEGTLKEDELDYTFALEIADYLTYQYAHNSSIYNTLAANDTNFTGVYDQVRYNADELAWYLYGNTSTSSTATNNQAIGGKTLASTILSQFQRLIFDRTSGGDPTDMSYPITLHFGEQDPMMSLISLLSADTHNSYFRSMPTWGSAVIFELFSTGANYDFPSDLDDLWVRFYFHNGTDYPKQLMAYPILGNGPSGTDMQWTSFAAAMDRIAMSTLAQWCDACSSGAPFCRGVDGSSDITLTPPAGPIHKDKISPTIAGVIGALVTLVVAGLLVGLAMLVAGIRFHRVPPHSRKSELGGFKGAAKLASDPDLSLARNAAPPAAGIVTAGMGVGKRGHERVGSWELRQKEFGKEAGDLGNVRPSESFEGIDAVAARPVVPLERV